MAVSGGKEQSRCKVDESKNPTPKPVFGLPCQDTCSDGNYATIDPVSREMICKACPFNTYSLGEGGLRIDG